MSFIIGSLFFVTGCLSDGEGGSGSSSSSALTPIDTKFIGADSATNLDDTSIQIQWTPITSDSKIVLYKICEQLDQEYVEKWGDRGGIGMGRYDLPAVA